MDPESLVVNSEQKPSSAGADYGTKEIMPVTTFIEVAFPVSVPAWDITIVCVSDRRLDFDLPEPHHQFVGWCWRILRTRQLDSRMMENEFLKLHLDPASGSLVSLVDKRTGREWVAQVQALGILQYCLEANQGMTAWVIGQFMKRQDLMDGGRLEKICDGPYIFTYRWTRKIGDATSIELDITLVEGMPRVEFRSAC